MSDQRNPPPDDPDTLKQYVIDLATQLNGQPLNEEQLRLVDALAALPASPGSFVAPGHLSGLLH